MPVLFVDVACDVTSVLQEWWCQGDVLKLLVSPHLRLLYTYTENQAISL